MGDGHDSRAGVVPERVVASVVDVPAAPEGALRPGEATVFGEVPWWRPGWGDIARTLGWRWVILGPCIAIGIGFPIAPLIRHRIAWLFVASTWKLWVTALAVVVSMVGWGIRNVVKLRKDPFCIHCGYSLTGLPERGQCPECGRFSDPALMEEFRKDPHFFAHRHKQAARHPAPVVFAAGEGETAPDGTA